MQLQAQKREKFGKVVKVLRAAGFLPAELYGRGVENMHLSVPVKEFKKVYKAAGANTIVTVAIDGKNIPALIYEVVANFLTGEPDHVDFYAVRMDEKLEAKVPLVFSGESFAVKSLGGVLVKTMQELPVEGLPDKIPHSIAVDISKLAEIGNSIHVDDLSVPADVKVLVEGKTVVATIKAKMTEEQEAALAAQGSVEKIVVESEEKKAEREAEKAKTAEVQTGTAPAAAKPEAKK